MPRIPHNPRVNRRRERDSFLDLTPDTQKEILVIILLAVAAFCFLSFFGLAGGVGIYVKIFLQALLGLDYFIFPFVLILAVCIIIFPEYFTFKTRNIIGLALFLFSLNGLLHLIFARQDILNEIEAGGGYLGLLVSYPLLELFRFPSAFLILFALFLVSLIFAFNTSFKNIIKPAVVLLFLGLRVLGRLFLKPKKVMTEFPEAPREEENKFSIREVEKPLGETEEVIIGSPTKMSRRPTKHISIPTNLLIDKVGKPTAGDIKANAEKIRRTLLNFGIPVEMGAIQIGPTVTQYTLKPAEGIKLSRITALSNDLALALAAHPIRIEAPIPGKSLVGIEVPNQSVATVHLKEILESPEFKNKKSNLTIVLGKDVAGKAWIADLGKMPHLLVAGATGSGKTVCLNSVIVSLLYQNSPDELKFILIDPKRVELPIYNGIPHLYAPVITEVPKTVNALKWALTEMDRRFEELSKAGARNIDVYNKKSQDKMSLTPSNSPYSDASVGTGGDGGGRLKMPYIVIVIDELADLMVAAGSEVEACIIRLAQMARAVGIHLVVATQRPSVDIITGLIKANITSRVAFAVASQTDSRTILDTAGADKLLGRGDMLFISAELSKPKRLQGALVTDEEINKVVEFIKDSQEEPEYNETITEKRMGGTFYGGGATSGDDDPLLPEAKDVIMRAGKASASLLQRRLKVGYARAARLLDLLEEQGMIGPADGAKPREVLVPLDAGLTSNVNEEETEEEAEEEGRL